MINYDGKKYRLEVEGTTDDIMCELLAIIKLIENIFVEKGKGAKFRTEIIEALYDEEMTKMTQEFIKELKEAE